MKDIVTMSFNDDFGEVPCKGSRAGSRRSQERQHNRRSRSRGSKPRSKANSRRSKSITDGAATAPKRSKSNTNTKAGRVTRNPFLNFMREFRTAYWGIPAAQVVTLGAKEWKGLSEGQKAKYVQMAKTVPKQAKRRRRREKSRDTRRRRRHHD